MTDRLVEAIACARRPPPGPGLFVIFEGVDGAGKTTACSALAARLAERSIDFLVVNTLNHSFRDPLLSEAADYTGRIVLRASTGSCPPVPLTLAAADALRYTLLFEGAVGPALARGQLVLADSWAYKRLVKNALALARQRPDEPRAEQWLAGLFAPALREDICLFVDTPLTVAFARKARETTVSEVGVGGGSASERESFIEYQRTIRHRLRGLANALGWRRLELRPDATPTDVAVAALDVLSEDPRFPGPVQAS